MTLEEQFSRLIQILQLIQEEPWQWDAADLEGRFGVSRATIERDIVLLRQWGEIKRRNGKFGLSEMKFLPTAFSPLEALALRIAGTSFAAQAGAAYKEVLASALKKIDTALPQRTAAELKKAEARVEISQPVVREFSSDTYQSLQGAAVRHHPVDITYLSRREGVPTRRRVDPYGLTFKFGAWYLVGYCHLREDIRTFCLDRIRWLRVEESLRFRYPANFTLQDWLARGWQLQGGGTPTEVVLRFGPRTAAWIAGGQWHPTQVIDKVSGGSISFRVTVSGWEEMLYWVLSFGPDVEVLAPAELRSAVAQAAASTVALYAPDSAS
ncbi:MAG: helix-turn-helix transcriptional regulator [Capsulimonadaceae bacterium]